MAEQVTIDIKKKGETRGFQIRRGLGMIALKKHSDWLEFDCQKGDCGICIFHIRQGAENLSRPTDVEADFLKAMHAEASERLACQCRVFGPIQIELDDYDP
ncbi:2Fe-2S iron-sulfur cluster-binding protein [Pseudobacteriovorax antillogorgiicola]|uniref:2Fe-2S iron-sulfur cluster binding domain-containing protein n=1 Tax=Pseudobacteriovorax antillogorgiicola TaxID=1513793 RepID=A0A1Y6CLQ0_9BACT|nr:2Fe-2S iron-sulfur cluster-binding protein [Pseudobacteriovorax antillogorgiicola]TCS45035.1 2Fe-2S iron-sulfur cluster protein [Pseudobacteriovorax antillogorgiicola]SMF76144.1 2Fe-2S iron-sulfur cluster binding domain-containing protein [Pseudobacteriovorax antillogorgiicola]